MASNFNGINPMPAEDHVTLREGAEDSDRGGGIHKSNLTRKWESSLGAGDFGVPLARCSRKQEEQPQWGCSSSVLPQLIDSR